MRASLAWREPATRCGGHGKTRVAQEEGTDLQIEVQRACREMVSDSVLEEKSHKGDAEARAWWQGPLEKAHGGGRGRLEQG